MQVFHYCAARLKGVQLFETCTDRDLLRSLNANEGAIFNEFDSTRDLLIDAELAIPLSQSIVNETTSDIEDHIDEEDIDAYFLQADDDDPERWDKDHPLFERLISLENPRYKEKVEELVNMSDDEWEELPIYDADIKRYIFKLFIKRYNDNV